LDSIGYYLTNPLPDAMEKLLKILLLEDSPTDAEIIHHFLQKQNLMREFKLALNKKTFIESLEEFKPDVILSDHALPQFNSTDALIIARQRFPGIPFIMVTGTVSEEYAAEIMKLGADDYILKDRMARLPAAISTALKQRKAKKEIADYRYALDQSADVTITDQKGIIIYANENFCRISQYASTELIGKDHRIINSGYHPASFIKELWVTIAHGKIWHGEFRNQAKDGSFYWEDTTVVPFLDEERKPYQYLAIRKDITERKKAEQDLLQSQMRLKQAQEISHMGNWEINFLTHTSKWSDEAYRIYGLTPGDHNIPIEEWLLLIHPDDRENVKQILDESYISLKDISFHHRIIRKDGVIRHVYSESKFEFNSEGKPTGIYGISHDVTESKEAEEEVRKSNERFQYVIKASSDIIWELNFETKQYLLHEGKEKLFGTNNVIDWKVGVEGKYIIEEDREKVRQSFGEARMDINRTLWELEYRLYSAENSILYIINHAIFIRNEKGKAIRAIGAITDITDKKKLEVDLLEQQKHEQLNITATALQAQEKERNAIGIELHDNVNQILVGTNLILSIAKLNPQNSGDLISSCMDNLKDAIRENRKIAHVFVTPDLASENLIELLKRLMHNMLGVSGIKTSITANRFVEALLSDERKINIYRIAQEQCTNIVKYSKATEVNLTIATNVNEFSMSITDNGVGMDSNKSTEGIGLKNINGRLSIFNGTSKIITSMGKGFTLEITIPY
jgi:PAS domain S-box-containing protein